MQYPGNIRAAVPKPLQRTITRMQRHTRPVRRLTAPELARPAEGPRIVAYRCAAHETFRILWPEVDAPLVHPCPECAGASLRLIGTRPDAA